jgi:site-specific recombinase XerC
MRLNFVFKLAYAGLVVLNNHFLSSVDGGRVDYKSKQQLEKVDRDQGWRAALNEIMNEYGNRKVQSGRGSPIASNLTFEARKEELFAAFEIIRNEGGYQVPVWCLKTKHVEYVIGVWVGRGLAPSTLQKKVSVLRVFSRWIGKHGLVKPNASLFKGREELVKRTYVRKDDPRPESKGIDRELLFTKAEAIDVRFGLMLRVEAVFGLRRREVLCLRPHIADAVNTLNLNPNDGGYVGTKNRRSRSILIDTDEKRALLNKCKAVVGKGCALGWYDGVEDGLKKSENKYSE